MLHVLWMELNLLGLSFKDQILGRVAFPERKTLYFGLICVGTSPPSAPPSSLFTRLMTSDMH
eukprot:292353-Amphidinium_carterae.1